MDLIADIGATNTRCALLDDKGHVVSPEVFENVDFAGVAEVLEKYLEHRRSSDRPRRAALAIAAPVLANDVEMINIDWRFSQTELKAALNLSRLLVVNDFAAIAWALPLLSLGDYKQVGGGKPTTRAPLVVLGPGSGLGVASLVPSTDGWTAVSSEGGHVTLAATTPAEAQAIQRITKKTGHCSAERVLSGPGLVQLYVTLAEIAGRGTPTVTAADVTHLARQGEPMAGKTLDMFFAFLGTVAADLTLTLGARGGAYVAGGIVPQHLDLFEKSSFRQRFETKGRYSKYLESIPTFVITESPPAFRGLRSLLGYR